MRIECRPLPETLPHFPGCSPLLSRIYASRGVQVPGELETGLARLLPFDTLKGIEAACERLYRALVQQERILVIGDFDADGATSTAVALSALRTMGAQHVDFLVPNRFAFGYGLTPGIVGVAAESAPHLIITVDNGIASVEGVSEANRRGIDVLITDHHLPGTVLPEAVAIVNPNQPGCAFPSKSIAGVGVIFYVMLALRRYLQEKGYFAQQGREPPNMAQFLDLVALGTVADVVALDQNNRILVRQGLLRMRQGLCRPGIQALAQVSKRELSRLREIDLGFALAPRINAAGRLDDMSEGIACLLEPHPEKAIQMAQALDALNQERKTIEQDMKIQALQAIETLVHKVEQQRLPAGLCLVDQSWHQGVIGILAGRLKERYHRPVIAFAVVDRTEWKASARSIPGLHIRDLLAEIDKNHPGLLKKFGGHAMAAGLSIAPESFSAFQKAFVAECERKIPREALEKIFWTDGTLADGEILLDTALQLQEAGPWGQEYPEPRFHNTFEILEQRLVGQNHLKLSLTFGPGGQIWDAIAFNVDLQQWPNHRATYLRAVYSLDVNVYQGRSRLQLMIEAMEPAECL